MHQGHRSPGDRKCWECGEPGHSARQCKKKKPRDQGLRAIEDGHASDINAFFMVDEEGFQRPRRTAKSQKPTPSQVTLGNFLSKNAFDALCEKGCSNNSHAQRGLRESNRPAVPGHGGPPQKSASHPFPAGTATWSRGEVAYIKERTDTPKDLKRALAEVQRLADEEIVRHIENPLNCITEEEEPMIGATQEKVNISVAMDSAAVDNVLHPRELPGDSEPEPNLTGRHFGGAQGSRIDKYGSCDTRLESKHGTVGCHWQLADVTRPSHSVAKVTGPKEGPGKQDVLFNNKRCVVVPPGTVDRILKQVKPVTEHERTGNLYLADMTMSSFTRRGREA